MHLLHLYIPLVLIVLVASFVSRLPSSIQTLVPHSSWGSWRPCKSHKQSHKWCWFGWRSPQHSLQSNLRILGRPVPWQLGWGLGPSEGWPMCVCVCMCVSVYMCIYYVSEGERERERVGVCVCVCVAERLYIHVCVSACNSLATTRYHQNCRDIKS